MRPQHDDHGGRPSPQPHPYAEKPKAPKESFIDTATFERIGRIRKERPAGKPGQHRLAAPRRSPKQAAADGPANAARQTDKRAAQEQAAESVSRFLTPAGPLTPGIGPVRTLRGPVKASRIVALGLLGLLGVAALSDQPADPGKLDASARTLLDDRADSANAANRSQDRVAASPSTSPKPSVQVTTTPSPKPKATATKPALVKPVAGLDQAQMNNAQTIVQIGQKFAVPQRGLLVAIMTAMQESDLYNQASEAVPESFDYPHQGDSVDYDSCGLFQQRASMGWGTVQQIMTPTYSAAKFYQALLDVIGWQDMELTLAAQEVQGSAYPYAYAKHESRARTILGALT